MRRDVLDVAAVAQQDARVLQARLGVGGAGGARAAARRGHDARDDQIGARSRQAVGQAQRADRCG